MSPLTVTFKVIGRPAPQGSKSSLGRGRFREQSPHLDHWRNDVRNAAMIAMGNTPPAAGDVPLYAEICFYMQRPKSHYVKSDRSLPVKQGKPRFVTAMPDIDKLLRSTFDAMSGVVYADDRQIASVFVTKSYADEYSASISILGLPAGGGDAAA